MSPATIEGAHQGTHVPWADFLSLTFQGLISPFPVKQNPGWVVKITPLTRVTAARNRAIGVSSPIT